MPNDHIDVVVRPGGLLQNVETQGDAVVLSSGSVIRDCHIVPSSDRWSVNVPSDSTDNDKSWDGE